MTSTISHLAREGHGAIQVETPTDEPIKVMLAGPIKHWWTLADDQWGTGAHAGYIVWRDAVEAAFVKAGFLVYSPHKAWRGAWSEQAQHVNDAAVMTADVLVDLTPPGIPNEGTQDEIRLATVVGTEVVAMPPSTLPELENGIARIRALIGRAVAVDA